MSKGSRGNRGNFMAQIRRNVDWPGTVTERTKVKQNSNKRAGDRPESDKGGNDKNLR